MFLDAFGKRRGYVKIFFCFARYEYTCITLTSQLILVNAH